MRVLELLLSLLLGQVRAQTVDDFMLETGSNSSSTAEGEATETPAHVEDKCRGYYDVMGQWDPPFVCQTGNYLYCCGTCGFRFCCAFGSSRLDQTTCKNYDTPPWMMTGRPPSKADVSQDASRDKTTLIVYVICGVVAVLALIGIFTKLGLEKSNRPRTDNVSRTLAHVIRHPPSEHTNELGLGQQYENLDTGLSVNSLYSAQMNNIIQASTLIAQPYPDVGPITSPYEPQKTVMELNQYATLKAVAEKANSSFFRQQVMEMAAKGCLPMEPLNVDPEPRNPYSPPRQKSAKQIEHKYRSPRSRGAQSLYYSAGTLAGPGILRPWEGKDAMGLRHSYGPQKLTLLEKEMHNMRQHMPSQPYFVTNSKTEVTV